MRKKAEVFPTKTSSAKTTTSELSPTKPHTHGNTGSASDVFCAHDNNIRSVSD